MRIKDVQEKISDILGTLLCAEEEAETAEFVEKRDMGVMPFGAIKQLRKMVQEVDFILENDEEFSLDESLHEYGMHLVSWNDCLLQRVRETGRVATFNEIRQFRENMRELRRHFLKMYGKESES